MNTTRKPYWHFLSPKYWPYWIAFGFLRLAICLPFSWQLKIGRGLGKLFFLILSGRRKVAFENISRCLPELSPEQRNTILREHFSSLGIGIVETLMSWWGNHNKILHLYRTDGLEHLKTAESHNKGVIILVPHFTHIDISGLFLSRETRYRPIYRKMNNPLLEELTRRGRDRTSSGAIPKDNIRMMIQSLKDGIAVTFLPDQNFRKRHSQLVPFFNIPAPSNVATSRIAKISDAPVVPLFVRRLKGKYVLYFKPALDDFPSSDAVMDTTRIHQLIEDEIRANPSQYLWVHRRFKR